jgi:2-(3-amino-3-carboxypropyl)histidine synthase
MSAATVLEPTEGIEKPAKPLKPRKRFIGSSAKASSSKTPVRRVANQIPDDILNDPHLAEAIKGEWQSCNL